MEILSDNTLHYILYAFICWNLFRFCKFIYQNFVRKRINMLKRYGENSWALVTGATDGLGKAYCEELAREGFNIILVSRTLEKLKLVADEIKQKFKNVDVHYIQFDFSEKTTLEEYQTVFAKLINTYDISILVNNVGINIPGPFAKSTLEQDRSYINVNIVAQTFLTKIFSDYLSKRNKRSLVIDLSSFGSTHPMPYFAMYNATKSFNLFLSRALAEEYKNFNVDFIAVKLLFAESNMSKLKANGWGVITSNESVIGVLNDIGYEKESYGDWRHKIQAFLVCLVPRWVINYFMTAGVKNLKKNQIKTE